MQVEYKRFTSWTELCSEEHKVYSKLKSEGKLRAISEVEIRATMIEHALNRLGKEGWKLVLNHQPYGVFMMRDVTKSPELIALEDKIGPTPGNTETKLIMPDTDKV